MSIGLHQLFDTWAKAQLRKADNEGHVKREDPTNTSDHHKHDNGKDAKPHINTHPPSSLRGAEGDAAIQLLTFSQADGLEAELLRYARNDDE